MIHEINAIDSSDSCLKGLFCFCVLWIVGFNIKCGFARLETVTVRKKQKADMKMGAISK